MEEIDTPRGDNFIAQDYIHYKKVNIFGDSDVGKSSLIELMCNYNDKNYQIKNNKCQRSSGCCDGSNSIIQQIVKVDIPIDEKNHLYVVLLQRFKI